MMKPCLEKPPKPHRIKIWVLIVGLLLSISHVNVSGRKILDVSASAQAIACTLPNFAAKTAP